MKMIQTFTSAFLIASMLGQSVAFAYDSEKFQELNPEAQALRERIFSRMDRMSEKAQLRLSYKLYKMTVKGLNRLEQKTAQNEEAIESFTAEETAALVPQEVAANVNVQPVSATADQKSELSSAVRSVVDGIGYRTTAKGKRAPVSFSEFSKKSTQLAMNKKSGRSIASNRSLLKVLFWVVLGLGVLGILIWAPMVLLWLVVGVAGVLVIALAVTGVGLIVALNEPHYN